MLTFSVFFSVGCSDDDAGPTADGTIDGGRLDGALLDGGMDGGPGHDAAVGDGTLDGTVDGSVEPPPCGQISTFEDGLQPTAEIHVATNGSDQDGDGSAAAPYATIGHAADQAAPGSAVIVHTGTYAGGIYLAHLAGTADAPIWIGGAAGENRPVIDASGTNEALHLSRPRYLIIHDLEIRNSTANGINCDDGGDYGNPQAAQYVIFRDLYIHDIGSGGNQDCLKLSGLNDYVVLDSEFTACGGGGSGSAIDHVGCHHGLIARNYMHDLGGNAVQCKGGSEDIEIRSNRIINGGQRALNMGGSTGFDYFRPPLSTTQPNFEARDIRAVANLFEGSAAAIAFVGCVECVAANNTIIDPTNWIVRILQETTSDGQYEFLPCRDGYFVNNLVYFSRSGLSVHLNIGPDTAPETFTFETNLWYAHDDPAGGSTPNLPVTENGGVVGQDPAFTNGYQIDGNSPAAGAGTTLGVLTGDLLGRCYSDPPSIGAYAAQP
jgi:hypothetical protein